MLGGETAKGARTLLEQFNLGGRVAIVTGGGRGLGREMALALSAAGAEVCIASRTASQLADTAAFIAAKTGRAPLTVPTDVRDSAAMDAMVAATVAKYGRLDILVNNAGIGDRRGAGNRVWELEDADWDDGIAVNLNSAFYGCRAAIRQFHAQESTGTVINVASGLGMRASAMSLSYGAAKAGVINLTKSVAAQVAGENIRVNCIVPGFLVQSPPETEDEKASVAQRGRFNTVGRLGEAWEMGPLAVFLASDAATYITGEIFVIDGGGLSGGIAPIGQGFVGVGS
jgi:NAD(P)-dependent dehydrogenase (short-subunit alcohol dehydrogenase family)